MMLCLFKFCLCIKYS
uniref:Uncharacterized protein n=1 Tax=Lepeophtheirus salmonis TaxID=72036 RepID=A0A0K2TZ01_LEPSM